MTALLDLDQRASRLARTRTLAFSDDERDVAAPVYVWRWLDHLMDCAYSPNKDVLYGDMEARARSTGLGLGEALAHIVAAYVTTLEAGGFDVTDDDLERVIAAKAVIARSSRRH